MTKASLEGVMQFMVENMVTKDDLRAVESHMATKDDLDHMAEVLERKIEHSEINLTAALYKQRLELKADIKQQTEELAVIFGAEVQRVGQRLTALEQRSR